MLSNLVIPKNVTNEVTVDVEPEQETVNETPPPTKDIEPVTVEQLPKPKAKPRIKTH